MPRVPGYPLDEQDPLASDDLHDFDETKPEQWPLFLPSKLSQDDRSLCHKDVAETERILRLAQVQDNLIDLRRLRRTLRSLNTYFKSNVIGEGVKTQTKSRTVESGVTVQINRTVRHYRLAYLALLSLDPSSDWRKEFLELTDKDNRGPGKELYERGVGDGYYMMSWIWRGSPGGGVQEGDDLVEGEEVNETVRHEWMTCRAGAGRWGEESSLLQEEMRRAIAFLEWTSNSWLGRVGSRSGSVTADVQRGIDAYARKQANTYHELAVSLANQWLPHLVTLDLDIEWAKTYPWATEIISPPEKKTPAPPNAHENPPAPPNAQENPPAPPNAHEDPLPVSLPLGEVAPSEKRNSVIEPANPSDSSGNESDDRNPGTRNGGTYDEEEGSDGLGVGFEYDDRYMS